MANLASLNTEITMKNVKDLTDDIDLLQHFGSSGVLMLILAPMYVQSLKRKVRMVAVTEIKRLLREGGYGAHEREIVKLAVGLGFSLSYPHNKAHVVVESEENLRDISTRAGFSKDFCCSIFDS